MSGPPASGKSTYAKKYVLEHPDTKIVSRDTIRHSFGEYNMEHEDKVKKIETNEMIAYMKQNLEIINDATNLNKKTREKFENLAKQYNYEVVYEEFYIPFKEAVERDKNEDRLHHVGEKVLKRFYRKYFPEQYEEELKKTIFYERIEEDKTLPKAIICDLDGTLAWMQHRSPYDLLNVDNDKFDPRMLELCELFMRNGIYVLFVSGREKTDECYLKTITWLKKCLNEDIYLRKKTFSSYCLFDLFLRNKKDYRKDFIIKEEIYNEYIKGVYDIICVFEDNPDVVKMWRENKLLCCQVNDFV